MGKMYHAIPDNITHHDRLLYYKKYDKSAITAGFTTGFIYYVPAAV